MMRVVVPHCPRLYTTLPTDVRLHSPLIYMGFYVWVKLVFGGVELKVMMMPNEDDDGDEIDRPLDEGGWKLFRSILKVFEECQ